MKKMKLALLFFFVLTSISPAAVLNYQFSADGFVIDPFLDYSYGTFTAVKGNLYIETSYISINAHGNDEDPDLRGTGDFITSGAITIDDLILPVVPYTSWFSIYRHPDPSAGLETYLMFDVFSPVVAGETWRFTIYDENVLIERDLINYWLTSNDPFFEQLPSAHFKEGTIDAQDKRYLGVTVLQDQFTPIAAPVPEPTTAFLLACSLGLVAVRKLRLRRH